MERSPGVPGTDGGVDLLLGTVSQSQAHLRHVTPTDGVHQELGRALGSRQASQPFFPLVFGLDISLLLLPATVRPGLAVARRDAVLPDGVGDVVPEPRHDGYMTRGPLVQVEAADPGDVRAEVTVDAAALNTDQNSQIKTGPVRVEAVAINTPGVAPDV